MDISDKDKFMVEKMNDDDDDNHNNMNYASVSYGQSLWNHPASVQTEGFGSFNVQTNACSSDVIGIGHGNMSSFRTNVDRALETGWNLPNLLPRGNGFLPAGGLLSPSTVQFPADSGFIERAARFSCFGGGNFSEMINQPLGAPESIGLFSRVSGTMQELHDIQAGALGKLGHEFKNDVRMGSNEEDKVDIHKSGNISDKTRSSGGNGPNETLCGEAKSGEISSKCFNSKKRKRNGQECEADESRRAREMSEGDNNGDRKQKDEDNPASPANKMSGGKQGKQASEPPKEGYIHVRARRGQATNSHSLAERVRREKISERMKFLQDLVPGCNKVTGKAVMLDEIINYVQSLQRQVEFLSMKLATVNPQLDFNLEGLLAKEALQLRPGPSSAQPFNQSLPMAYPPFPHLPQPGFMPSTLSAMVTPSDVLRRSINGSEFKRQETQGWEGGDLQNVIHMNYATGPPPESQEASESLSPANMKVSVEHPTRM